MHNSLHPGVPASEDKTNTKIRFSGFQLQVVGLDSYHAYPLRHIVMSIGRVSPWLNND
jgi:hypothetical protein